MWLPQALAPVALCLVSDFRRNPLGQFGHGPLEPQGDEKLRSQQ